MVRLAEAVKPHLAGVRELLATMPATIDDGDEGEDQVDEEFENVAAD
jgi:hypothetical protein